MGGGASQGFNRALNYKIEEVSCAGKDWNRSLIPVLLKGINFLGWRSASAHPPAHNEVIGSSNY